MADASWNQASQHRTTLSQEADVWRQFANVVRQEIDSIRGELEQWQREHVEPLRQSLQARENLASRAELASRVEIERTPSLALREPSITPTYATPLANPAPSRLPPRVEEEDPDDDRLRFLKERLARQLGTEGGGA